MSWVNLKQLERWRWALPMLIGSAALFLCLSCGTVETVPKGAQSTKTSAATGEQIYRPSQESLEGEKGESV